MGKTSLPNLQIYSIDIVIFIYIYKGENPEMHPHKYYCVKLLLTKTQKQVKGNGRIFRKQPLATHRQKNLVSTQGLHLTQILT